MKSTRRLSAILFGILTIAATGCGQAGGGPNQIPKSTYSASLEYTDPFANGGHPDQPDFSCPTSANVLPTGAYHSGLYDRYTVCASKLNSTEILFYGTPYREYTTNPMPRLCVYPIDVVTNEQTGTTYSFWKPDAEGKPMRVCAAYNSNGMKANFPLTHYNAVYIVREIDQGFDGTSYNDQTMRQCLYAGRTDCLPEFSSGKFRD